MIRVPEAPDRRGRRAIVTVWLAWVIGITLVGASVSPSPALAQTDASQRDAAQKLVDQGLKAARGGSFGAAAEKFEAALKLYPHPEIAHNLARAQEELGKPVLAITYFRQALEMDANYTFAVDARARIGALDKELRATHGVLKVASTPDQVLVTVEVDGEVVARELVTPASVYVKVGRAVIRGAKAGYLDAELDASVAAGADVDVELLLRPVPKKGFLTVTAGVPAATVYLNGKKIGAAPLKGHALEVGRYRVKVTAPNHGDWTGSVDVTDGEEASVAAAMTRDAAAPPPGSAAEAEGMGGQSIAGYALIGVGGATVVTGAALHILAVQESAKARKVEFVDPAVLNDNPSDEVVALAADLDRQHQAHVDKATTLRNVAAVGYAAGAAMVGIGIVLIILDAPEDEAEAEDAARLDFTPTIVLHPERVGMGATLRF